MQTQAKHMIDGDSQPFVPAGWKVVEHQPAGQMKIERRGEELFLNGEKLVFHLSEYQKDYRMINGHWLRGNELSSKKVVNANVLDYLLAHPELIPDPDSWKNTRLFFWGTIYGSRGHFYVRCLGWYVDVWYWGYFRLHDKFSSSNPAAVLAE